MSFKTSYSTFLSAQLRSMGGADKLQFQSKMREIRTGTLSHHKVLQGTGGTKVLTKAGKTGDFTVEEASCGLGGKWRIFFYRTGYHLKNTLEVERHKQALGNGATIDIPDGVLWCILIGHLEGGDLELFVPASRRSTRPPSARSRRKTRCSASRVCLAQTEAPDRSSAIVLSCESRLSVLRPQTTTLRPIRAASAQRHRHVLAKGRPRQQPVVPGA